MCWRASLVVGVVMALPTTRMDEPAAIAPEGVVMRAWSVPADVVIPWMPGVMYINFFGR